MRTSLLSILVIAVAILSRAQEKVSLDGRITGALAQMASPDRGARNAAFDDMVTLMLEGHKRDYVSGYADALAGFLARHPDQTDRVKVGFINMLKADNADEALPGSTPEDNSEHYAEAIYVVASFDDERAIPALLGAISTGEMATEGLVKYRQKALGPVLTELHNNPNVLMRVSAFMTAVKILRAMNDPASRVQMLSTIRTALSDSNGLMRETALWAIEGLVPSDKEQFVAALQQMARQDPFIVSGQNFYRLREKSKKLLEKIGNQQSR